MNAVPECAHTVISGKTLSCLKTASSHSLLIAFNASMTVAGEEFPWSPTIDGPGGLYPDYASNLLKKGHFARLPFIAGTNLDEGIITCVYQLSAIHSPI